MALASELDHLIATEESSFCFVQHGATLVLSLGGRLRHELGHEQTVAEALEQLGAEGVFASDGEPFATTVRASLALAPGNSLVIGDTCYLVQLGSHPTATVAWLDSLGLARYASLFAQHGLEDYFSLVFLTSEALDSIGLTADSQIDVEARKTLLAGVDEMRGQNPVEFVASWLSRLGCDDATIEIVRSRNVDLQAIREQQFDDVNVPREMMEMYKNFSSVEETFHWLRRHGFEKYSFHFARYNIPFYALPCVNFFIIDEMGVTHDDQMLLQALQSLKQCHHFDVCAVAFWLRDLELERYNVVFARAGLLTLEALTELSEKQVEKLVSNASDCQKLKTGIQEMQEFQFYYLATASLLQELGMERYSQLFALHGISIDVLPFLTEKQLIEMGIQSKVDRKKILSAIEKIKHEIPQHAGVWGNAAIERGEKNQISKSKSKSTLSSSSSSSSSPPPPMPSVDELLEFISGGNNNNNNHGSSNSSGKKKKRSKNRNKKKITLVVNEEEGEGEEVKAEEKAEPLLEEEDLILDPALKRQVDAEVDEFRRRLESCGSSKAKLTPIFYLESDKL